MTRLTRLCRAVGVGLAVLTATLAMTQVAHAELPTPTVPDAIKAPAGNEVFLVGHVSKVPGAGAQIYTCNGTNWVLPSVPRADLLDDAGKLIIKHFAGPTWQEVPNGSSVVAQKLKESPSPILGPDGKPAAIPWLLLQATKTTAGRGGHLLSDTTFIQRINTTGGLPPAAAECTASKAGTEQAVNYTADYYFYKAVKA
jgi:hypothetical protein